MNLSTEEAVKETYRVALQETLKKDLKTDQEFGRYQQILTEAAERVDAEKDDFRENYQTRLSEAQEVILREQTALALNHPRPPNVPPPRPPSPEKITLLVRERVQADHEARIAAIRKDQVDQYRDLQQSCRERAEREAHARDVRLGHAKQAFTTANQISPHEAQSRTRSGPSQT